MSFLCCCTVSPLPSPTHVAFPSTIVPSTITSSPSISLSRRSSIESLSSSHTASPPSIKTSPSQRFPHLSPQIMRILSPHTEMPIIAPNCQECSERYRREQDHIINKLMQFVEEE